MIEQILKGARGRRLLLEFALHSERCGAVSGELLAEIMARAEMTVSSADDGASFGWLSGQPWSGGPGPEQRPEPASAQDVAASLDRIDLTQPTATNLRSALARSVGSSYYWQEPEGFDLLARTSEVREALIRIAEHVARSPVVQGWKAPVDLSGQWAVQWPADPARALPQRPEQRLRADRAQVIAAEDSANASGPSDPTANISGEWWSMPSWELTPTMPLTFDESPAALWFSEDRYESSGTIQQIGVPQQARVFEIVGAADWAQLCRSFPLEVTARVRQDWFRTTGRAGRWVIPDWYQVAQHFDAVHLQTIAYLEAAGAIIPVDGEGSDLSSDDVASSIAGWNPDETYWLTSELGAIGDPVHWVVDAAGETSPDTDVWIPESRDDGVR